MSKTAVANRPASIIAPLEVHRISTAALPPIIDVDRSYGAVEVFTYQDQVQSAILNYRDYLQECKKSLIGCELTAETKRIAQVVSWLLRVDEEYDFYVGGKPLTEGCTEALRYRYDPQGESVIHNEIKSIVCRNNSGEIFYFLMPGDMEVKNSFLEEKKLQLVNPKEFGILPYTLNPATVFFALEEYGVKKVNLVVHKDLKDEKLNERWLYNNLGSRFLSCKIQHKHFIKCLESLKGELVEDVDKKKTYKQNGGFVVVEQDYSKDIFQKGIEFDGRAQIDRGDYGRHYSKSKSHDSGGRF